MSHLPEDPFTRDPVPAAGEARRPAMWGACRDALALLQATRRREEAAEALDAAYPDEPCPEEDKPGLKAAWAAADEETRVILDHCDQREVASALALLAWPYLDDDVDEMAAVLRFELKPDNPDTGRE